MDDYGFSDPLNETMKKFLDRLPDASIPCIRLEDEEEIARLNHQNFKFYEPKIVYFGFQLGKERNREMEKKKFVYATQLCQITNVDFVGRINQIYRDYFHEGLRVKIFHESQHDDLLLAFKDSFIDACFVIQLILKYAYPALIEESDPIFHRRHILQTTIRDMFVITNQLPFIALKELFNIIEKENSLEELIVVLMEQELCLGPIRLYGNRDFEDVKHLVAFVRDIWVYSSKLGWAMRVEVNRRNGRQQVIGNASELRRAGIRFKGVNKPTFDLKFSDGILEIPVLSITEETECFLQNVVAYEQISMGDKMVVVSDYCVFMDCLIQSTRDVQLLRECGVINSYLHDDKDVVKLFDNVGKRTPSSTYFSYSHLFDEVNKHCVGRWNSRKAKLRRDFFKEDKKMEVASFLIALYIILPVTVLQTVYTILSYYK